MKTLILVLSVIGLVLFGCSPAESQPDSGVASASVPRTVDAACGACIYGMDGVQECELAVEIDGKPYLVSGVDFDTHGSGLCSAKKTAVVKGEISGDKFVATEVKIKP